MSPFIFLCPGDSQPVCSSSFSYNHSYGFIAGFVYHHRCFDICWEILRHLLAPEAPNTFNASIQTFYLDGVDIGYPCFHDICSAIPKPNGCVLFYGLFLLVTICGQNIGIWRKFQQKIVPCHQNRAMQIQRLTKPLSIVSVVTLSSLRVFAPRNISSTFFMILASLIFSSSSFVNPMVYALRIAEFEQALNLLCFRRHGEMVLGRERERVNIAAADLNDKQLTFEQEVLEDTKLWLEADVRDNRAK